MIRNLEESCLKCLSLKPAAYSGVRLRKLYLCNESIDPLLTNTDPSAQINRKKCVDYFASAKFCSIFYMHTAL